MVKFLIKRPIAVLMGTFAFLLLGVVASLQIPTSLMPDIAIPEITVQLTYPNNTARELETNVVRPLRHQLLQVTNLKDIESETRDGFATLKLIFEYGTNTDYVFIETNEKIDASLNYLPRDLDRPKVIKASATDIPILNITVSLKDSYSDERFLELSEFTETVLKKRIEQLPDIAMADMSGQTHAEIIITPDKNKLKSLGITNQELVNVITQNNFELGNLSVQNGIYQYNFKFSNPLKTKRDIENIFININKKLFKLKDLATVNLQPKKERGLVYLNGKRAIVLAIIKQSNARVYDLKEVLEELTLSFKKDYPNLEFLVNQDQTTLLKLSINNLKSSLWIGSLLAILIMFFFLKDIKSPLIIGISIPVSLIISLLLMYIFGLSINIISLSGLILGVGMMIDNSIIVIDNITQKLESGLNLFEACASGTNEIIAPLISSVLTTCSVFLPLLFLSGITGALFYDQAVAVSIGLGSSLIVSILLIPVIYRQLKNKSFSFEKWLKFNTKTQYAEYWYEKGYNFFFGKKWIVYCITISSIIVAIVLFQIMTYTQLPEIKQNETIANIDWNENINVEENQNRIQNFLKNTSNIELYFSQTGEQQFLLQRENTKSFSEASIYIKADNPKELEIIKTSLRKNITNVYPRVNIQFSAPKTIFEYIFGVDKSNLYAQITTKASLEVPSEDKLNEIDELIAHKTTTDIALKQTTFIQIIQENIVLYNVNYDAIVNELKTAFNENFVDNLKTAQKFIPIKLNYETKSFENIISNLFVRNEKNINIPVRNLIKFNNVLQYKSISANRNGEYLSYKINTTDNIENDITTIKKDFRTNENFDVNFSGNWLEIKELNTQLIKVTVVALLLLYFIMAAQFESLWQPLIILLEIPIDIGGALLLLWLFGGTINVMAAIGIVVMSGVIINDSILKIHTINLLRKKGFTIEQAIKEGGKLRLKPILMTSMTTILALTPFLIISGFGAELQKPLALTVIGGMLVGTFISLYFIPLIYYELSKKSKI